MIAVVLVPLWRLYVVEKKNNYIVIHWKPELNVPVPLAITETTSLHATHVWCAHLNLQTNRPT